MLRWSLIVAVLLAFAGCGGNKDAKEPGEKVVNGQPAAPLNRRAEPAAPHPAAATPERTSELPAEVPAGAEDPEADNQAAETGDPSEVRKDTPDRQPVRDRELEVAVEVGLHETTEPDPDEEEAFIDFDERGRIVGDIPDTTPDLEFLYDTENFVCPADSLVQGARPPKGREVGCRHGGMLVGPFIEWYESDEDEPAQRRVEKGYVDGVKQGPVRQWYRDGSLMAIRYFHRGRPQGLYARWHVNKRIAEKGEYEAGKEIGRWVAWYPNGNKESEGRYDHGWKTGPWTYWYPNGQKRRDGLYERGQKTGKWMFWHNNGQLEKEGIYLNDYPTHRLTIYDEDGTVLQ